MIPTALRFSLALATAAGLVACSDATPRPAAVPDPTALPEPAPASSAAGSAASTSAAVAAADRFLASLTDAQRSSATFAFDDAERTDWHYVPRGRAGLPLQSMDAQQREAAFAVVDSGLSARGASLARGVIELEGILGELEGGFLGVSRDPERYYLTVFGQAADAQPWGWRFEGHHLSVNVTELGPEGQVVAPLFIGANPARIPGGPKQGLRLLADEQDLAFALLDALDPAQRTRAVIAERTFGDIVTGADPAVQALAFAGLPASAMTAAQQQHLRRLLEVYAGRMADAAAARQLQRIDAAGFGELHFAWAGAQRPDGPHYYRIHGPTVLVEYDNSQDDANHIHTVWRDLENDFGGDLLRRHHARSHTSTKPAPPSETEPN